MIKTKSKKIYLLLAGGTILSEDDAFCVEKEADMEKWLNRMPELKIMADLIPVFICGETSGLRGPALWQKLSAEIFSRLDSAEGFIVTSGLSNILYNAISVSFGILNLNKPVVFTGSQLPVVKKELVGPKKATPAGLGIKANLINAMQMASMDFGGSVLIFGNRCLRAVRSVHSAVYSLNVFNSLDDSYLAKIDFGVTFGENLSLPVQPPVLKNQFADKVVELKYYPGLDFECLSSLAKTATGLMLNVSNLEFFSKEFAAKLKTLPVPVLAFDHLFVPGYNVKNIIECSGQTKATALVKFSWALGQTADQAEIRRLMNSEFCHEFLNRS
ncbi:MAG: asparaginase domain-containing protein [Candidatus Komeilibacteria bacterium]|nr:asparaginase domain-containing protein [Candidatus Komeilibacteria bacterium]